MGAGSRQSDAGVLGRGGPVGLPGSLEASPSPVYGARLLSGFGTKIPSRVQIPPPPPSKGGLPLGVRLLILELGDLGGELQVRRFPPPPLVACG